MANTQTTVPLFVANQVLTASQQNLSAGTGVPVFATTVTRDAAFGGSNKALAEGQLCYIEASNIVQYYDGAAWATLAPTASKVAQVLSTTLTTTFTTASTSWTDITGVSQAITPTLNTSKILVIVQLSASQTVGVNQAAARLVRDSTAIDIGDTAGSRTSALAQVRGPAADTPLTIPATYLDSPATTSAITYKMQAINLTAGTFYVNRSSTDSNSSEYVRTASTITVMEILA
jgi:hypothetical protein